MVQLDSIFSWSIKSWPPPSLPPPHFSCSPQDNTTSRQWYSKLLANSALFCVFVFSCVAPSWAVSPDDSGLYDYINSIYFPKCLHNYEFVILIMQFQLGRIPTTPLQLLSQFVFPAALLSEPPAISFVTSEEMKVFRRRRKNCQKEKKRRDF